MESLMHVIDRLVILRLSLLLGYVISLSAPFARLLSFFLSPSVFTSVIEPLFSLIRFILSECLYPVTTMWALLVYLGELLVTVVSPVVHIVSDIVKVFGSFLKLILYTPFASFCQLVVLLKDGLLDLCFSLV